MEKIAEREQEVAVVRGGRPIEPATLAEVRRARLEQELPRIVGSLKAAGVDKVILFGSVARGERPHAGTDLDLLVVMDTSEPFVRRAVTLYGRLQPDVPVDFVVYTPEEFLRMAGESGFVRRALREGRILYDSSPDKTAEALRLTEMKLDSAVQAQRWMHQAEDDLGWAKHLMDAGGYNLACFHAQQVAEKALKAYLYGKGEEQVYGHGVQSLCDRASRYDQSFLELKERIKILDTFYIPTRYPNALASGIPAETYGLEDAQRATALAEEALAFIRARLPSGPDQRG